MAYAFVSYSSEDERVADGVARALENAGIHPLSEFARVAAWHGLVDRTATDADIVIVLWSSNAARSRFLKQATTLAIKAWAHESLILAKLDETELPAGLRDIEFVSLAEDLERGIERVVDLARRKLPEPESPSVAAMAAPESARTISPIPMSASAPVPVPGAPAPAQAPRRASPKGSRGRLGVVVGIIGAVLAVGASFFDAGRPVSESFTRAAGGIDASVLALAVAGVAAVLIVRAVRRRRRPPPTARADATPKAQTPSRPASSPPMPAGPHIFVSYSRRDRNLVDRLVREIEGAGARVWIDRSQQAPGHRFAKAIGSAIRASRHVAVMCSQNSFDSDHVVREIYLAGEFKKPFIAFELDEAMIPDELLYFLTGFPRLSARTMEPAHLRAELARLLA